MTKTSEINLSSFRSSLGIYYKPKLQRQKSPTVPVLSGTSLNNSTFIYLVFKTLGVLKQTKEITLYYRPKLQSLKSHTVLVLSSTRLIRFFFLRLFCISKLDEIELRENNLFFLLFHDSKRMSINAILSSLSTWFNWTPTGSIWLFPLEYYRGFLPPEIGQGQWLLPTLQQTAAVNHQAWKTLYVTLSTTLSQLKSVKSSSSR